MGSFVCIFPSRETLVDNWFDPATRLSQGSALPTKLDTALYSFFFLFIYLFVWLFVTFYFFKEKRGNQSSFGCKLV